MCQGHIPPPVNVRSVLLTDEEPLDWPAEPARSMVCSNHGQSNQQPPAQDRNRGHGQVPKSHFAGLRSSLDWFIAQSHFTDISHTSS